MAGLFGAMVHLAAPEGLVDPDDALQVGVRRFYGATGHFVAGLRSNTRFIGLGGPGSNRPALFTSRISKDLTGVCQIGNLRCLCGLWVAQIVLAMPKNLSGRLHATRTEGELKGGRPVCRTGDAHAHDV